jgi:hypothetical protein
MKSLIENTRNRFGKPPRTLSVRDSIYNSVRKPLLMRLIKDKRFDGFYQNKDILLSDGEIVWGFIVQANTLLFKPAKTNHPATLVFSKDLYFDERLDVLENIATALYDLKGRKNVDKEVSLFAEVITDQMTALFNTPIPKSITMNKAVYYTTIMVHRKHLPLKYLNSGWFPLLVSPHKTKSSMILPSRYWSEDLVELWSKR